MVRLVASQSWRCAGLWSRDAFQIAMRLLAFAGLDRYEGMMFAGLIVPIFLLAGRAPAEYRAFLLEISPPPSAGPPPPEGTPESNGGPSAAPDGTTEPAKAAATSSRTVVTNLDDQQYREYYHVDPRQQVLMKDSWMCWERTGSQPPCRRPERTPTEDPGK